MPRTETHLDGMLRHLGAAYYDSLQGKATQADVTRAVDTVAEHLNEQAQPPADGAAATRQVRHVRRTGRDAGVHGWSRREAALACCPGASDTRRSPLVR